MAPIIGSWPVARNRLDFVRPSTVAGQIAVVSVVVGKMDTRIRDGPDGTPVRETVPGIGRRITLSGHPFVYGVRAIRTADGPRSWSCKSTRWSTMFR